MASSKITYASKTNTKAVVDRTKQSTAEDWAEVKTVVNSHADDIDKLADPPKAAAYISTPAKTTFTTADTFYPILGTFTNYVANQFEAATTYTPGIKYAGTETLLFEVDWQATFVADDNSTQVHGGIYKNGVYVAGSEMSTLCKTAGEEYSVSGTAVIELETGDEIQLVAKADRDGDAATAEHFTTTIRVF